MEPDILAQPSEHLAGAPTRSPESESGARELESPGVSFDPVRAHDLDVPLHDRATHGRTNGHLGDLAEPVSRLGHLHPRPNGHANGHTNGYSNGHALGHPTAIAVTLDPAHVAGIEVRDEGLYLRVGKRLMDIVGASVALVLSAPVLLIAAICIKIESRGPVLYRSTRIGRGGRPFTFYKLRSMVNDADQMRHRLTHLNECDGPVFKICRDPRVTRVGRFLRSTSIDEMPQFVNVLRGEMSLVGPRPPIPEEVSSYEPWQLRRLDVEPGITCLWQISGRSRIGFQEWMRLDLEYIRNRSLALDLKILLRTIPAVLSREGAY